MSVTVSSLNTVKPVEQDISKASPSYSVDAGKNIIVENLPVSLSNPSASITAIFRAARGSDYKFVYEVMNNRNHQSDLKLLSALCSQWGEDATVTVGELEGSDMPLGSLLWLINEVVLGELLRLG